MMIGLRLCVLITCFLDSTCVRYCRRAFRAHDISITIFIISFPLVLQLHGLYPFEQMIILTKDTLGP